MERHRSPGAGTNAGPGVVLPPIRPARPAGAQSRMDTTPAAAPLLRALRGHRDCTLLADETPFGARSVLDPATGRLVLCIPAAPLAAGQLVLFVPEESDNALQMLVTAEELDPRSDSPCDRWRAYHGEPRAPRWLAMSIVSARLGATVVEGQELMRPNALRRAEPALLRAGNADQAALRRLCRRAAGVFPDAPVLVGVDELGMDVRARFGIIRVEFPRPAPDADDADAVIRSLLRVHE